MSRLFSCRILANLVLLVAVASSVSLFMVSGDDGSRIFKASEISDYQDYVAKYEEKKSVSSSKFYEKVAHFIGRTMEIFEHNMWFLKKELSYHLEQNQFSDMSYDDLRKFSLEADDLGAKARERKEFSQPQKRTISDFRNDPRNYYHEIVSFLKSSRGVFWEHLKDEGIVVDVKRQVEERVAEVKRIRMRIDWRITNCISEPRQQSLCNSCYAISVVSLIEYYHCREAGELKRFSPQYIVDCGQSSGLRGCEGGKLTKVGQFIEKNGLQLESDFPYTGQQGQCQAGMKDNNSGAQVWPHFKYWQYIQDDKTVDEWLKHAQKGPLLVGIGMPADFFAYAGGIHDGHNCDQNMIHAMLLVGYGIQDDQEFWLLQNSFSKDWGENGYFRLLKDAPRECFKAVIVAQPAFDQSRNKQSS